ncbi:STAS domain-containing protein [Pseudokineococcus basanitobsidens]|uniref:STAS domain-containing protein n=1 Tax=Pseudokineococcus basanitobsidens TaxID=1926649 RepID=A0ABU8RMY3_9ACTN
MSPSSTSPPAVALMWPDTLLMAGDVDVSVVRRFTWSDRLAAVEMVDLSAATSLDTSAVRLLLRCVEQVRRHHPGRRLQVVGASPRVRAALEPCRVDTLVDLVDLASDD